MKIYTIRDDKAAAYLPPFCARQNGEAIRMFQNSLSDSQSNFAKWPEDYILFELGEFNEDTGVITPLDAPKALGNGIDFKNQQ